MTTAARRARCTCMLTLSLQCITMTIMGMSTLSVFVLMCMGFDGSVENWADRLHPFAGHMCAHRMKHTDLMGGCRKEHLYLHADSHQAACAIIVVHDHDKRVPV